MEKSSKRRATNINEVRKAPPLRKKVAKKTLIPESKKDDSKRRLATTSPHSRVITGFCGGIIPEYKGNMPRVGHTAFIYNQNFYIFGGMNAKGYFTNHFFYHEKRSFQWKELRGVGVVPPGRMNHSLVFCSPNKLMIYGGHRNLEVFDTLYTFNLETSHWEKINYEKGQNPGPVFLHAAVYVPTTNSMFVIGGFHQRTYDACIGHVFEIRNRVWTGFPGPKEVDSQQVHLVTATYHEPSASVVVLGLRERNSESQDEAVTPFVYLLNVNTLAWTRVKTPRSPESPVLFRMDVVWSTFTREFVMMGGFHDEVQQSWYFPLNLSELPIANANESPETSILMRTKPLLDPAPMKGSPITPQNNVKGSHYGFFKLHLNDYTWSVVESKFPHSILKGLVAKTRERINDQIMQTSLSEYSGMFASSPKNRSRYRSSRLTSDVSSSKGESLSLKGLSPLTNNQLTAPNPVKRALLYTVKDAPMFQRKYTYAAYYHASNNVDKKKLKPFQYLVMHGGLQPGEDYAMLIFTPENSRAEVQATQDNVDSHPETNTARDSESELSNFLNVVRNTSEGTYNRNYADEALPLEDGSINLSFPSSDNAQLDVKDSSSTSLPMVHGATDALLQTLPVSGGKEDVNRFALLYHEKNSVTHLPHLLLYPNCPVAILNSKSNINEWATRFYSDSRAWLAERLKEALTRDRKARKNLRLQKQQQKNLKRDNFATRGRGGSGLPLSNTESDTDISEDSNSSDENMEFSDPNANLIDSKKINKRRDTTSSGKVFADMPTAQSVKDESEEAFQRDFFSRNDLDLFSLVPRYFSNVLGITFPKDSENDTEEEIVNLFNNIGPGRMHMNVKRRAELQRLPSAIFRTALSSKNELAHHVGDLGSATAFVLLTNALKQLEGDDSLEASAARARLRWRFLRAMVRTGEAAFILYRVNRVEVKKKAFRVTSSLGLLLAPELHLVGPTRTHKVPSRPVPYVLPRQQHHLHIPAEVTPSGMVVYKNLGRNVG